MLQLREAISFKGKVTEVAYYGETSSIFIADQAGHTVLTNIQNAVRDTAPRVRVGDELWCSWNPRDTLVLTA